MTKQEALRQTCGACCRIYDADKYPYGCNHCGYNDKPDLNAEDLLGTGKAWKQQKKS